MDQKALDTVREAVEESFSELKPGTVEFAGSFMIRNFPEEDIRNMQASMINKLNERLKPQGFNL